LIAKIVGLIGVNREVLVRTLRKDMAKSVFFEHNPCAEFWKRND